MAADTVLLIGQAAGVRRRFFGLHRRNLPQWGSDYMRTVQMAQVIAPHLPQTIAMVDAQIAPDSLSDLDALLKAHDPRVVILTKNAYKALPRGGLRSLRRPGIRVGLDLIDMNLRQVRPSKVDFLIASSSASRRALLDRRSVAPARVHLVHHLPDPRVIGRSVPTDRPFSVGYFGLRSNAVLPGAVESRVAVHTIRHHRDVETVLPALLSTPLHYGVRPPQDRWKPIFKPFTKGFMAAHCGAALVLDREVDDAVELLGEDYPLFVRDRSEAAILEVLEHAATIYGTARWDAVVAHLSDAAQVASPRAVARQFAAMLEAELPAPH